MRRNLRGRLLIYYGTADNNVHQNNSMQLIQALQRAGKSFEVQVGPDQPHTGVNAAHDGVLHREPRHASRENPGALTQTFAFGRGLPLLSPVIDDKNSRTVVPNVIGPVHRDAVQKGSKADPCQLPICLMSPGIYSCNHNGCIATAREFVTGQKEFLERFFDGNPRPRRCELDQAGSRASFAAFSRVTHRECSDVGSFQNEHRIAEVLTGDRLNFARQIQTIVNGTG